MLAELHRKGGCLCQPAREGALHCPLIIRPTSEDVITDHLVQVMRTINPRWWLPDFLNSALAAPAVHPQQFRNLRIEPWVNKPTFPRDLLHWDEGSTQVDIVITWENPATTVYVEMKYWSELSARTSENRGEHGYASDQLARNIRVGLLECGYFEIPQLFEFSKRDFLQLVISPGGNQKLVQKYRDPSEVRQAIPYSQLIKKLPKLPFVGELDYFDLMNLFQIHRRMFSRAERVVADQFVEYLAMKSTQNPRRKNLGKSSFEQLPLVEDSPG